MRLALEVQDDAVRKGIDHSLQRARLSAGNRPFIKRAKVASRISADKFREPGDPNPGRAVGNASYAERIKWQLQVCLKSLNQC